MGCKCCKCNSSTVIEPTPYKGVENMILIENIEQLRLYYTEIAIEKEKAFRINFNIEIYQAFQKNNTDP